MAELPEKLGLLKKYAKKVYEIKVSRIVAEVEVGDIPRIVEELIKSLGKESLYLTTLVATDLPEQGIIRLDYFLSVLPEKKVVVLRAAVPREDPRAPSLLNILPGVFSAECEVYDLMGVVFEGNPHLRRGFFVPVEVAEKGIHPLKKDVKV